MEGTAGSPKLLTVEEKWQIIFNEKTRAPIYGVTHYLEYLTQFASGESSTTRDSGDITKKDGIHPVSYLLRKLKLDLKMSYESFIDEFLKQGNNGMVLLIKLLKSIQNTGSQQSGSSNLSQLKNYKRTLTDEHDCLLCIKYAMRSRTALALLLEITYGLETVAMGLLSTFTKSRGTAIEILTVALSATEGFSRVLDCFTYIRLKIGEPVRFKSLMNMMNLDSHQNILFRVSCMKFLNSLLNGSPNLNTRVYLQHELETAGLDINSMEGRASGTGLEFDDLRVELTEWRRKYIDIETLLNYRNITAQPSQPDTAQQQKIEELQRELEDLKLKNANLERKMEVASSELRLWYGEQKRRNTMLTVGVQAGLSRVISSDSGCQCNLMQERDPWGNPLRTAAEFFGWQDSGGPNEDEAVYYTEHKNKVGLHQKDPNDSDDGVEKVNHWLRSYYDSSESDLDLLPLCFREDNFARRTRGGYRPHGRALKRNHIVYPSRHNEIRVNWGLAPKFSEHFPSRYHDGHCHTTNCDRCRAVRETNKISDSRQNKPVNAHINKIRPESQSSDSALGGSGERLWNGRGGRIPLLPAEEAELLQDMIQPDDSASGVPPGEPYPDYSSLTSDKHQTEKIEKSYNAELAHILKEFEGDLNEYANITVQSGPYKKVITIGDV